jgi:hypothetical protein
MRAVIVTRDATTCNQSGLEKRQSSVKPISIASRLAWLLATC